MFERLYLQKYLELQPRIWHAFIILTKVILGIFWAILETDTWEPLVELTRNDPSVVTDMSKHNSTVGRRG